MLLPAPFPRKRFLLLPRRKKPPASGTAQTTPADYPPEPSKLRHLRRRACCRSTGAAANSRSNWASRSFNEASTGLPAREGLLPLTLEIPGAHPHKRHRPRLQRSPTLRRPNPTPRPTDPSNTSIQIIQTLLNTAARKDSASRTKRHRHPTSQSITLQLRQLRNAQPKSHRRHKTNVRETSDGPI